MQTLKTALVVTFLLAVLYAVYITLNKPEQTSPPVAFDANQWAAPEVTLDFESESPAGTPPASSQSVAAPHFEPAASGSAAPPSVEPVDPYANRAQVPPLAASEPSPAASNHQHGGDSGYRPLEPLPGYEEPNAEERPAGSPPSRYQPIGDSEPADEPPLDEPASPEIAAEAEAPSAAGSPYANARSETVIGSESVDGETDPGSTYRPYGALDTAHDDEAASSRASLGAYRFKQAWSQAQELINDNKFARALAVLTLVYREADLPAENRRMLLDMLDRLAGTVIYSTEHRLELPYEVARGETLEQIAQKYQVPALLLYNINRGSVNEPDLLLPGTQLKVMRGPFRAEITIDAADPARGEATLFLGSLYAGRFPVTFGEDLPTPGREYEVIERLEGKPYYRASSQIPARAPDNPYGLYWLGFDDPAIGLHGQSRHGGEQDRRGSIRLSERDAADVYGILSVGSPVKILQ